MSAAPPETDEARRQAKLARLRGKGRRSSRSTEQNERRNDGAISRDDPPPPASDPPPPAERPLGFDGRPIFVRSFEPDEAAEEQSTKAAPPPGPPPDRATLEDRWGTCVYLLRSPSLASETALDRTRSAARDGVAYVLEVKATAGRLGIRSGALSKMLLPYARPERNACPLGVGVAGCFERTARACATPQK